MSFPAWAVSDDQLELYTDARLEGLDVDDPILQYERLVRRFLKKRSGNYFFPTIHLISTEFTYFFIYLLGALFSLVLFNFL